MPSIIVIFSTHDSTHKNYDDNLKFGRVTNECSYKNPLKFGKI